MTWSVQDSRETFGLEHWGEGYFDINDRGHVAVHPRKDPEAGSVDLFDLAQEIRREGLALPVLVRFTDVLRDRVLLLQAAFDRARAEYDYTGGYTPVYPIKVNQQRGVVEGLIQGDGRGIGLEAGSKSELLAILALSKGGTVICNGYKDRSYIRLALIGRSLGLNLHIVIEKLSELDTVLSEAEALGIEPQIGVRVRLASIGAGKWQNSGGEKSKFGLHAGEILRLVRRLKEGGKLGWLKLMHFHMGSQVANIADVKTALREAGRYYVELRRLGAEIEVADAGGGLGVDYEGTRSTGECSINYSMDEYAGSIVRAFAEICEEYGLPQPHLVTESGRAMTAHHAVLITHIIDVEAVPDDATAPVFAAATDGGAPAGIRPAQPLLDLVECLERLDSEAVLGIYHDGQFDLAEARAMYVQGKLNLAELAEAERLNAALSHAVRRRLDIRLRAHREALDELNERLADKVFCNFSLFQSMPDAWAIDQIFPVLPLQRLDQEPTRRGVIQDLTCDSDGQIDTYLDRQSLENTLALHERRAGEPYLIGIFLVGAYQEILGDMHNLFGDTHSVNVELDGRGGYRIVDIMRGDGADELLRYVHIDPEELKRAYHKKLLEAELPLAQRKLYESELMAGLGGYTYLEE